MGDANEKSSVEGLLDSVAGMALDVVISHRPLSDRPNIFDFGAAKQVEKSQAVAIPISASLAIGDR